MITLMALQLFIMPVIPERQYIRIQEISTRLRHITLLSLHQRLTLWLVFQFISIFPYSLIPIRFYFFNSLSQDIIWMIRVYLCRTLQKFTTIWVKKCLLWWRIPSSEIWTQVQNTGRVKIFSLQSLIKHMKNSACFHSSNFTLLNSWHHDPSLLKGQPLFPGNQCFVAHVQYAYLEDRYKMPE